MTVIEASVSLFLIAVIAVLVWVLQRHAQAAIVTRRKSARATLLGTLEAW